jgi:hypothetical protein
MPRRPGMAGSGLDPIGEGADPELAQFSIHDSLRAPRSAKLPDGFPSPQPSPRKQGEGWGEGGVANGYYRGVLIVSTKLTLAIQVRARRALRSAGVWRSKLTVWMRSGGIARPSAVARFTTA